MHTNLVTADAAAVRDTVRLVAGATADDFELATPCAGWDLGTLLTHMTVQHRGFAAAASGRGADPEVWAMPPGWWLPDLVREYAAAAEHVLAAFEAVGSPDQEFLLPELSPDRPFPARRAIGFHLVDYVVHGWDVARTLNAPFAPAAEVLAATLPIARAVPTGEARLRPGAAFAPARTVPADADPLSEILLLLGRDPAWRPAVSGARHT
jgi:uncharacterized protein (TIGR03086 family)